MIDIQVLDKKNKWIRHSKDQYWDGAHAWLSHTGERFELLEKEFDKICIEVFTTRGLPVDDRIVKTFEEAHEFLREVLANAKSGKYPYVWVGNERIIKFKTQL